MKQEEGVACKGNNCNKSYLVEALCQLSSDEKEKFIWIKKLDAILSIVNKTWNKTIIITADTNIDYRLLETISCT